MAGRLSRQPLSNEEDKKHAMLFYLTHCKYESKYHKIIMNGLNDKGEVVAFVVGGSKRYFFLQFHSDDMNPVKYPEQVNKYLRCLERQCRALKEFHVPKTGDIQLIERKYNPIHDAKALPASDQFHHISHWAAVDDQYKTMYGWTPGMLKNIIQVWVNQPKVCDALSFFVESREYCILMEGKSPSWVVRMYEGQNMPDDLQFRSDRGLVIDQWCHVLLKPYQYERPSKDQQILYADIEYHCNESCFYPLPPNTPTPPPLLRILSHDIEAVGKGFTNPYTDLHQTRFPVPLWRPNLVIKNVEEQWSQFQATMARYLQEGGANSDDYKKLHIFETVMNAAVDEVNFTLGAKSANGKFKYPPWANLEDWYEAMHGKYEKLEPFLVIPNPLDTDAANMIVAALNIYNQPRSTPLHFADSQAFVYTHPKMQKAIDRSRQVGATAAINDEFDALHLHTFNHELDMIAAFVEYIHEVKPSVFTGWNIDNFDLPFLWERCQFYHIYQSKVHQYAEHGNPKCKANPFGIPNFGLLREVPCKYIEGKMLSADDGEYQKKGEKKEKAKPEYYLDEETGKTKKKSTAKKNASRLSQAMATHINTPFVTHMDGIVVWRNLSFGVKSTMESKGSTPQYSLDNVSAIELKYPNTNRPRRKLQVSHSKTEEIWRAGGSELWFFICYCYVDATLPLFLLEKHAKVQLLFSIASICNCSMDVVYNNGMQSKISCLFYEQSRQLFGGKYLVPEWGRRGLHWPDVWLHQNPYEEGFRFHYLKPRPVGAKGYMGAWVADPSRGLHTEPIFTNDFTSLYPSLAFSYEFDYNKFLTEATIKHYAIKANQFVPQVLGPQKTIFCGELTSDPMVAEYDEYRTPLLKTTYWKIQEEGIMSAMIKMLFDRRSYWKVEMAKWTYYSNFLSIPETAYPTNSTTWDRTVLVPMGLQTKLGKFWQNMNNAAVDLDTWLKEKARILSECMGVALPGEVNWIYVADTQVDVANAFQLGFKLILNSMYGFTTASLDSAILPLMELGASITSQGRRIIKMTAAFGESLTVSYMKNELDKIEKKMPSVWPFTYSAKLKERDKIGGEPVWPFFTSKDQSDSGGKESLYPHEEILESSLLLLRDDAPEVDNILAVSEQEIQQLYEEHHRQDHFQLHGGDTDSVMIGHARKFRENGMNLTLKMAGLMVSTLNKFLRGCMGLTHEKTAIHSLFVDPKNYFMSCLKMPKLLCKGVEIVRGDIILFVNRILSKAANDMIHTLDADHFEASFMRTFRYIQVELYRFIQGQIPLSELILHKKLAKTNYVNAPEHVMVEVGDFIEYVYARNVSVSEEMKRLKKLDKKGNRNGIDFLVRKGGEIAESVNYVIQENIPLDLEHYWMSCIVKPVSKFFRHIIAPKIYPPVFDTLSLPEQNKIEAFREYVKQLQFKEVHDCLFAPLEKILLQRCEVDMRKTTHIQTIDSFFTKHFTLECQYCNTFFEGVDTNQKVCDPCNKNSSDLRQDLKRQLKTTLQEIAETRAICLECVSLTGFPQMDIEDCTKYDCEIYEKRSRLLIDKKQFTKKIQLLEHIMIEFEPSSDEEIFRKNFLDI